MSPSAPGQPAEPPSPPPAVSASGRSPGRARTRVRVGAGIVLLAVGLNVMAAILDRYLNEPGGPPGSSYSTGREGLAAYASLLRRDGRRVQAERRRPSEASPPAGATLVLVEPEAVGPADARALRRWVTRGGHLVAGGAEPEDWLGELLRRPPRWEASEAGRSRPVVPVPETVGVRAAQATGEGAFSRSGATLPALGSRAGSLLTVASIGRGRVALLADPSPLTNADLVRSDNAALALALVGPSERPVLFAEWAHGFGTRSGLAALPGRWRIALAGLVLSALVFLLARGRRFGPPELEARALAPPRSAYVEAMAAALARSGRREEAAAPVRAEARRRLARRVPGGSKDDDAALRSAARHAGLDDPEVDAVLGPLADDEAVLALGRALTRLPEGVR